MTLRATFNRENLFYEVRKKPAKNEDMVNELVKVLNNEFSNQTGIIYCFSRKECEELTNNLKYKLLFFNKIVIFFIEIKEFLLHFITPMLNLNKENMFMKNG